MKSAWRAAAFVFAGAVGAQVAPPTRFERVLWCETAARAVVARDLGFTAVQLPRGADPAPLRALGLSFYLDQPIGKGLLELRDEEWQPIARAYERTRDPAVLVRPACFAAPGVVETAAAAAAMEATRVRGDGLLFVALADEASATRHDAPLDTCRCEHCTAAYRTFVRSRFATIDALNSACGTLFASFDDVVPTTTDQVRRRELGDANLPANLRPFGLLREFTDAQFATAVRTIAARVESVVPKVPVGLTGLQVPAAFGGSDFVRLLPAMTLAEPYAGGAAPELARSLLPTGAHRYATLFPPTPDTPAAEIPLASFVRASLAAMVGDGLTGVVVWNDANVADPAGKASPFGAAIDDAVTRLQPALDACAGAQVETGSLWVVESPASVRAWWMLDSAADGLTWIRRLSSYERDHSTSQAARLGWTRLLQDLGQEPRFVAETELPVLLLQQKPKCLVLPATIALSDRAAQAMVAFVRAGGTVVADHSAALYDEALALRPAGGLDDLFGIGARSFAWNDLLVRQGRSIARDANAPVAEARLAASAAVDATTSGRAVNERRGDAATFLERVVGKGRAVYLNAPVCEYANWRLDEGKVAPARDLRRRVRAVLQQAGVDPPCEVRGDGLPTCIQRTVLKLRDGRTVIAIRVNALDEPRLLQRLAASGPRNIQIDLPTPRTVTLLGGATLGTGTRFDLQLDPFGALFLEVSR